MTQHTFMSFIIRRTATITPCSYKSRYFRDVRDSSSAFAGGDGDHKEPGDGARGSGRAAGGGGSEATEQDQEETYGFLSAIVREYIIDGSPNEINIG